MERELYNLIWEKLKMIYDKVERLEKNYDTLEKNIKIFTMIDAKKHTFEQSKESSL